MIGPGALDEIARAIVGRHHRALLVIDSAVVDVAPVTGLAANLAAAGVVVRTATVTAGESLKTMSELTRLLELLEDDGFGRRDCVVAIGGGTVGDLAGFAAAIWQRGIAHYQAPTTLLAMIDASVGGKTGVNGRRAKNAIGAIWQPALVAVEPGFLVTLPEWEYRSALGEVVKYAFSLDATLVEFLEGSLAAVAAADPAVVEKVVAWCVRLKAEVVAADPREGGRRQVLNYGHTFGHALEVASGYRVAHGRCVAAGLQVAARVAVGLGLCSDALVARQDRLLAGLGLPGALPRLETGGFRDLMARDKKSVAGQPRWVLPVAVGRVEPGIPAPAEVVEAAIRSVLAGD